MSCSTVNSTVGASVRLGVSALQGPQPVQGQRSVQERRVGWKAGMV